ncbi:ATP-binding protein [Candidatus Auribacterota bacterium]
MKKLVLTIFLSLLILSCFERKFTARNNFIAPTSILNIRERVLFQEEVEIKYNPPAGIEDNEDFRSLEAIIKKISGGLTHSDKVIRQRAYLSYQYKEIADNIESVINRSLFRSFGINFSSGQVKSIIKFFDYLIPNAVDSYIPLNVASGKIYLRLIQSKNRLILEVEDKGNGIEPAMLQEIPRRNFLSPKTGSSNLGGIGIDLFMLLNAAKFFPSERLEIETHHRSGYRNKKNIFLKKEDITYKNSEREAYGTIIRIVIPIAPYQEELSQSIYQTLQRAA